jgi:UDP-N-acetylmuramyl pentapeptide synthase
MVPSLTDARLLQLKKTSKIAVLDLTHGGAVIARHLLKIAGSVTAVDVYGTMTPGSIRDLEKEGIKTSTIPLKSLDFDVIVAPVHLDSDYPMLLDSAKYKIPVISHHAAVGIILKNYDLKNRTLIEITGTKAKTSTSILLASIVSRKKNVVSLTSRGLEDWSSGKIIKKGLSITPASVLAAIEEIMLAELDPDVCIFEISLGGTGSADIGVITTITNDYKIANNTGLASDAKRQMILNAKPGSTLVINNDALRFFGACRRDVRVVSFSDSIDASCNVYYEEISGKGGTIAYFLDGKHGWIKVHEASDYDINSYKTVFVCATAVALAMGVEASTIEQSLRDFKGAEGRMTKLSLDGRTLIDNSNSGMDIRSAEKALSFSQAQGGRIIMILGEEAKEVCEGLDPAGVERFINKHVNELDALILVGERMKPLVRKKKIHNANDLTRAIELAKELSREKDIILSCVKCFR